MTADEPLMSRLAHGLQSRLFPLLAVSFLAAALAPAAGLWMRGAFVAGSVPLPSLLLALLLLNAGLGVEAVRLRPGPLCLALAADLAVPVLFVAVFARACGGSASTALARLAGSVSRVTVFVAAPMVGVALRRALGEERLRRAKPWTQAAARALLLALCYATGAAVLPGLIARPDWGRVGAVAAACAALCGVAFGAGGAVALFAVEDSRRAVMLGLGRMHGSTGLALSGLALAPLFFAPLALVTYVVAQHGATGLLGQPAPPPSRTPRRAPAAATWRPRRPGTVLYAR